MKYPDFIKQIGKNQIQPVYFFNGPEDLLMEEALIRLKKAVLTPGSEDLNYHPLSGPATSAGEIIPLCETLPFLSPRRLVVVRELEGLPQSDQLIPYLNRPCPSTCLVLAAGKVDARKRLFSALKSLSLEVYFGPLNDAQVQHWIQEETDARGMDLKPGEVAYLKDRLGHDLYLLKNEIEKISLATADARGKLEAGELAELLAEEHPESVFDWLNTVKNRDREKAIGLLGSLLDSGQHPLSLLGLILSHLRRASRSKPPAKLFKPEAPGSREVDFVKAWAACLDTDSRLKGSRISHQIILESLVMSLCGSDGKGNDVDLKLSG